MTNPTPILDSNNQPSEPVHRTRRLLVLSILALIFGSLSTLNVAWIEILNYHAGFVLPMPPLAADARGIWRTPTFKERNWRIGYFQSRTDPTWDTRPLTPADQADFARFRARAQSEISLQHMIFSSCLLYPTVALLLITLPFLIWDHRSRRWRIVLTILLAIQILAAITMVYRGYFAAVLRAID
jgi:hypothetical protein